MIATPAYSGNLAIPYALSYSNTVMLLAQNNIQAVSHITCSGSLLVAERNNILQKFWDSDCTHLLCIDADLGWSPQAVLEMLKTKKEFIAGCYPARGNVREFLFRPVKNANGSIVQDEKYKHLLKMDYVPAGFMLIARSVIEKMRNKHPHLYYEPKDKRSLESSGYCFFNTEIYEGEFWGEDYTFCRKAREAGVEIWVDPLIQFNHAGTVGMLQELFVQQIKQNSINTVSEAA